MGNKCIDRFIEVSPEPDGNEPTAFNAIMKIIKSWDIQRTDRRTMPDGKSYSRELNARMDTHMIIDSLRRGGYLVKQKPKYETFKECLESFNSDV